MLTESKVAKMIDELAYTTGNGGFINYDLEMDAVKALYKLRQAFRDKRIQEEALTEFKEYLKKGQYTENLKETDMNNQT
jgi:hypothetical protein